MTNPFEDILKTQTTGHPRKLSHEEACGYYAALRDGVTQPIVSAAAGLSQGAISHLAAAGERKGGQIRYPKVAAEYLALGREPFIHKYVTTIIRDRLRVAQDQVRNRPPSAIETAGVNPRANKDRGRHAIKDPSGGPDTPIEIAFDYGPKPGWKWRAPSDEAAQSWRGDPRHEERGFATSADAKAFCQTRFGPSDEEIFSDASAHALDDSYFWDHRS